MPVTLRPLRPHRFAITLLDDVGERRAARRVRIGGGCGHAGDEAAIGEAGRAGRRGNAQPAIRRRPGDLFGHHIGR